MCENVKSNVNILKTKKKILRNCKRKAASDKT